MKLPDIHFYDVYTPIIGEMPHAARRGTRRWRPCSTRCSRSARTTATTLAKGLRGRWCDRYENKGKRSGAFSSGCYDSDPYILMNYQPDVLDHVFTLAHEAGHSMHSHLSKGQPYQYANYTIFVAEVASTFNEQLLGQAFMAKAKDDREQAYFVNREIDDIRRTIVRQTMFAEFEKVTHELAERNEPLTLDRLPGRVPPAAGGVLRPGLRARRRAEPGGPPHPALLPGVLRVQVRHRPARPRSPWPTA